MTGEAQAAGLAWLGNSSPGQVVWMCFALGARRATGGKPAGVRLQTIFPFEPGSVLQGGVSHPHAVGIPT